MILDLIVGLPLITFGIFFIRFTYKNPDSQLFFIDLKGYIGGGICIIIGIMCLTGNGGDLMDGIRVATEELKAKFK